MFKYPPFCNLKAIDLLSEIAEDKSLSTFS